jgi:formylglycine-generating enzyme required for sulfatase activity
VRQAVLLALAEFDPDSWTRAERDGLVTRLVPLYRDDPDPGVHASAGWLLRRWGQEKQLDAIDEDSRRRDHAAAGRRWYVNSQGQTMVLVPAPGKVSVGGVIQALGSLRSEVEIRHSFALAAREVTVAEFCRCPRFKEHEDLGDFVPTPDCPVSMVTWYEAAEYCNWLSEREGIPRDQWCYLPNEQGKYAAGMKAAPDFLKRLGYRLPMEAEWECACRAGSETLWSMGEDEDLLARYAWFIINASDKSHPVGLLRPNDWGLFDMHGNAWEWCQDRWQTKAAIDVGAKEDIRDKDDRLLRGGAFNYHAVDARSANRSRNAPGNFDDFFGFRPARTYR